MKRELDFTEGRILGLLLKFMGPVILALFLQAMYGAADLLISGQFASTNDVSAVATGSQIMHVITTLITSFTMGITVFLGQKIGEKKYREAGSIMGSGIALFLVVALVLSLFFIPGASLVARLMNAPAEAYSQTVSYLRICSIGIIFIVAFNVIGGIFRGIGDSKMPLITVAITCTLNIFLDLLFIAGYGMGATGAALATVISQGVSVVISILIIRKRKMSFEFQLGDIRWNSQNIGQIVKFGAPIATQDLMIGLSFTIILLIVNKFGVAESAAVGVAQRVCQFLMLIPLSYMQSLSAFVAQNVGAGKMLRARRSLFVAIGTSLVVAIGMFYLGFFHGDLCASVFAKDPRVIILAGDYLKGYAIDCLFTAELFCFNGFFSGIGKSRFVMLQGALSAMLVRVPVAYIMSLRPGASLFMIALGTPAATLVQIITCGIYYRILFFDNNKNRMENMEELFDVCDDNGIPTGQTVMRSEAHAQGVRHRTAHVWIIRQMDDKFQILMQKRSEDKDSFPGCYDTSSAGHIKAGDEPLNSALRELEEELGISASEDDLEYIGTFENKYEKEFHGRLFKDNEVPNVFIYTKPVDIENIHIQEEELSGVEWFDLEHVYEEKLKHNPRFCVPVLSVELLRNHLMTK